MPSLIGNDSGPGFGEGKRWKRGRFLGGKGGKVMEKGSLLEIRSWQRQATAAQL